MSYLIIWFLLPILNTKYAFLSPAIGVNIGVNTYVGVSVLLNGEQTTQMSLSVLFIHTIPKQCCHVVYTNQIQQ